ncbi:hypothetical protein K4F52_005308 [Lecanicillium sp. MT-2017a]|nr:hypothetical protein K4F52_005308 [Lecanicillium sp. MT-2017a]
MTKPLIQTARMRSLMVVPIILAIVTALALFARSDVNAALLWSQCHARSRIPAVSRIPGLGTPLCFLISFFQAALDSLRTRAVMAMILSFVGSLLTVCTSESARSCNRPARVVANPTPGWLLFNLLGGAVVWQLLIVPAYLQRARNLFLAHKAEGEGDEENTEPAEHQDRNVAGSEVAAIPLSVAAGYYVPSILMLVFNSPATIGAWLLFPLYVSVVRQAVRWGIQRIWASTAERNVHLETNRRSMAAVYAIPLISSLLSHGGFIWNLTRPDDRKELTRSTVSFIEIDFAFIGATILYWVFVEVGWKVPLSMVGVSAIFGPGAGTLAGWILRERVIQRELAHLLIDDTERDADAEPSEQTPLIPS